MRLPRTTVYQPLLLRRADTKAPPPARPNQALVVLLLTLCFPYDIVNMPFRTGRRRSSLVDNLRLRHLHPPPHPSQASAGTSKIPPRSTEATMARLVSAHILHAQFLFGVQHSAPPGRKELPSEQRSEYRRRSKHQCSICYDSP
jgi:hypothetical protein